MAFRFEELKIWQQALELSNEIDMIAKAFPADERFSLASQIKNTAEGSTGQSKPEFRRFLGIALRSAIEVVACLFLAKTRNYIVSDEFETLHEKYEVLCKMITKFRDGI